MADLQARWPQEAPLRRCAGAVRGEEGSERGGRRARRWEDQDWLRAGVEGRVTPQGGVGGRLTEPG